MIHTLIRPVSTITALDSVLLLPATLSGCGTLFLHSDRAKQDSRVVRAAYDKADPKTVFKAGRSRAKVQRQTLEIEVAAFVGAGLDAGRISGACIGGSIEFASLMTACAKSPSVDADASTKQVDNTKAVAAAVKDVRGYAESAEQPSPWLKMRCSAWCRSQRPSRPDGGPPQHSTTSGGSRSD